MARERKGGVIQLSGDCVDDFERTLERELGKQNAALTMKAAREAVEESVLAYERAFGPGEVGINGSGEVAKRPPARGAIPNDTTGLLYGKVQSGKTNAAIALTALAAANGFRCFVVLTSDNTLLGTQTFDRFREKLQFGPTIYSWENWRRDPVALGKKIKSEDRFKDTGVVFVTTKNAAHLQNLEKVLKEADAGAYPSLILDDEADNASLDNNVASRSRASAAVDASRIHELIGKLRREIHHHVYLQVTATPQGLFLQKTDNPCRPRFYTLSYPGDSYVGGEIFFGANSPYCVASVTAAELKQLESKGKLPPVGKYPPPPSGMRHALACFFLGCAQKYAENISENIFSFLAHVSIARINHQYLAELIDAHVSKFDKAIRGSGSATDAKQADAELERAYAELSKTCKSMRPLAELRGYLVKTLRNVRASVINAESTSSSISYQRGPNIFVGGNRLSRGVTIKGLMVTYYGRDAKSKMMDTVHQHARMFGYRKPLLDTTRLFSTPAIIDAFKAIHEADEAAREIILNSGDDRELVPVWVGPNMKATRSNVLDPGELGVYAPRSVVYPWCPAYQSAIVTATTAKLDKLLEKYESDEFHEVSLEFLAKLIDLLPPSEEDDLFWRQIPLRDALVNLKSAKPAITKGRLFIKRGPGNKDKGGLEVMRVEEGRTDTAGGEWIARARNQYSNQPTLILSMQKGTKALKWDDRRFYAPTVVFPKGKFAFMYSYT